MSALASNLNVAPDSLSLFPTLSIGDAIDVFIGLHSSPFEVPGRIVDTILSDPNLYNTALRGNDSSSQVELAPIVYGNPGALVFQCATEAAAISTCEYRGCRSRLATLGTPSDRDIFSGWNILQSGASAVGPSIKVSIDCWCNGGDPLPPTQEPITCLDSDSCFNGGFCRYLTTLTSFSGLARIQEQSR